MKLIRQQTLKTNWKTTVAGILQFLGIAAVEFGYLLDLDPLTVPNWSLIVGSLITLIGLLFARDADVTSEDSGLKG